jgi:hypothetical protein
MILEQLEQPKKAPRAPPTQCDHGRQKSLCKDCGTNHCDHGRQKYKCKDCSPKSFCQHGRRKGRCRDCGAGFCQHGRQKDRCKGCRTGYCQHGRLGGRCGDLLHFVFSNASVSQFPALDWR